MAPEVVEKREYGTKADTWSAGVLLYLLLSGRLPFSGNNEQIYDAIQNGRYSVSGGIWNFISNSAKDLLIRLLNRDQEQRFSATEALQHDWLRDKEAYAPRRHLQETVDHIKRYNARRKLKSTILAAVNTDKWSKFPGTNGGLSASSSTFFSGDLPGGDSCHPDGCTKASQPAAADLRGAHQILESLDRIAVLTDSPVLPQLVQGQLMEDGSFRKLLQLYEKISQLQSRPVVCGEDASILSKETVSYIETLLSPSPESLELRQLLQYTDVAASLQALDVVVEEVYGAERDYNGPVTSQEHQLLDQQPSTSAACATGASQDACRSMSSSAQRAGTSHEDYLPTSFTGDDDDDILMDSVSRVRLVQFQKDSEEPMGITLKVTEEGRCFVARIMHGGMIHRQATLHVGDEIREINGVSVAHRSVESLQQMLRDARGQVTFKIVPSYRSAPPACEIFVRAQFDYEPGQDDLIPCPQAGMAFKTGDILQVISKDDHNWWQARFISGFPGLGNPNKEAQTTAGLIPSPELQEWRTACLAMERAKDTCLPAHCMWFNKKKKYYSTKYLQKHSTLFDQLDLVTYEEVMRLSQYRRKTLVLLGAHGVGRRHIKNTLIHRHPQRFAYPIPHTTRQPRKDELDGKHYFFVSNEQMMVDIQNNEYLEYGTHEESMYGTKLETIRNIHKSGKVAILDVEPQALKVLRTAEYSPFVVFIAAPNLQGLQDPDGSLERLLKESEILRQAFGHLFDYVIVNNDIDETIAQLERLVEKLNVSPQWLPVSWVY
ncbi:unnamed protein product, partial [Mesorhabditis spiculigera]